MEMCVYDFFLSPSHEYYMQLEGAAYNVIHVVEHLNSFI